MELFVCEETLKKTQGCERGFVCLKEDDGPLCKVLAGIDDQTYIVECTDPNSCQFKVSIMERYCCKCPVRQRIYDKYKK